MRARLPGGVPVIKAHSASRQAPTERLRPSGPGLVARKNLRPTPGRALQTDISAPPGAQACPSRRLPAAADPPAGPTERLPAPSEEPGQVKEKRVAFVTAIDPSGLIIVVSLVIAGLIGAELYVRNTANNKVAEAVACEVKDKATAWFGVTPLILWQLATKHFTNISVHTAGNNIRDAKGMKITLDIEDVQLKVDPQLQGHHRFTECRPSAGRPTASSSRCRTRSRFWVPSSPTP